ncbi:uncharacterized protein A1O9_12826 [Exophiala aquamarina CBS 119918]|uniref:Uncharacterized protein n=1 Tax=Exophiala aquamarina CBS 119918 TaxID=1182545 RepID=A0A072NVP2_9EURO|nr:uncharacterized protein A1O9_12826 [Exophiala aquamarina CBS 119918]KEF51103.1 hypothetical protein A1O9_12826 [Exophiala aquamarina CBS 119918]
MSPATGNANPSYRHARHISSLMKEPLIDTTEEDQQPASPPARPRRVSQSLRTPSYNHARHVSSLMKPLPMETDLTAAENPKADRRPAPPVPAAPLSSIAYQIWPPPNVNHRNISGRLSKPFGLSTFHDLETRSAASIQEKLATIHIADASSPDEGSVQDQDQQEHEWVPRMLRPRPSYALAACFAVCVVLLQVFDILDRTRGGFAVGADMRSQANYIPTLFVVPLGFLWSMLLQNLKEVGPWSLMARGWTRAEDGLYLVNYIDALDIRGFALSVRVRQFGVSLGYIGAVLCGALLPFANTLFFTDPIPRMTTTPHALFRTSRLLVNDTLTGNGGSTKNSSAFDPQSFITYMAIQRESFGFPRWTIQQHAFDSFNLTAPGTDSNLDVSGDANITLTATASAFGINTTCDPISWTFYDVVPALNSSVTQTRLMPNLTDLVKAKCIIRPEDYPQFSLDTGNVTAWFNYTTCGEYQCSNPPTDSLSFNPNNCGQNESDDLRLMLNVWNPDTFDGDTSALSTGTATISGLLCKIGLFTADYEVRVDAREARLLNVGNAPTFLEKLSIKNPESIVLKVNQFLRQSDGGLLDLADDSGHHFPLEVFLDDPLSEAASSTQPEYFQNGETGYFPGAVRPSSDLTRAIEIDPIILMMSRGNNLRIANYAKEPLQMQKDMSDLLQTLVSQIVNTEYRRGDAVAIEGLLTISTPVIRMRQVSLRILQAILIFLLASALLTSTKFRPRTHLRTDPRTLGAMAMLLSRSGTIEKLLQDAGCFSERAFLSHLRGQYVRTMTKDGYTILELQDSQRYSKMLHSLHKRRELKPRPWYHTSLTLPYLMALGGAIALAILTLGLLWWRNETTSGIAPTSGQGSHAIIYFLPVFLILLTYAIHIVDVAVQCLQPYILLSSKPVRAIAGLSFNPSKTSPFTVDYQSLKQSRSTISAFSFLAHLIVPTVKLIAAGLFFTALQPSFRTTSVPFESSLVSNLDTYNLTNFQSSDAHEELLRARAMTLIQSNPSRLKENSPVGLLDGLIFSNVTNRMSNEDVDTILDSGADMRIRIPAIKVTPICRHFSTENYTAITPFEDVDMNSTIDIVCNEGRGLRRCPSQRVDSMFTALANSTNDLEYFWNRDSLVGSPGSSYAPQSPEFDGLNVFQNVTTFLLAKTNQPDPTAPGFKITDVASFWCNMNYSAIEIDVTVSRPRRAALGTQQTLPLAIKSYDVRSITHILDQDHAAYNISHLNWTSINRLSTFRSVYPLEGRNLLYHTIKMRNPKFTDDDFVKSPKLLSKAGGKILKHFAAIMIDSARPFVDPMSATQSQAAIVDAQVVTMRSKLIQDKNITIALQVLLGTLLLYSLITAFTVNRKVTLVKAPHSIGSQISLLTGSELVRLVRDEDLRRRNFGESSSEDALWGAWEGFLVHLGWWERAQSRSPNLARSEIEVDTWIRGGDVDRGERRFGIDVGEAARRP